VGIAWGVGQVDFNDVRIQRLNAGVNNGLLLDVVVLGVVILNKDDGDVRFEDLRLNRCKAWRLI
jgi:hypothetical protein